MLTHPNTLLVAKYFPPIRGGSTRIYEEIYGRYPSDSVSVLTQRTENCQDYDERSPLRISRTDSWGDASLHPRFVKTYGTILRAALRLTRRDRSAAIHCDTVLPAGLIGMLVSRVRNIPYVIYAHGEEIQIYQHLFPEKQAMRAIYKHADAIITNGEFTRRELLKLGVDKHRIRLILPGVDTDIFQPEAPAHHWQDTLDLTDKRVLLTVGRLEERKGHDQVIRALPRLLKKIPNMMYVIAGTGAEEGRLKQLCHSLGVERSVHFLGFVADDLLPSLYNLADVFVMPNRQGCSGDIEGFGMVFVEANACGKPVVAGRSGGVESAVIHGETGLLVDGENLDDLCGAILRLVKDERLSGQLGANGRKRAVEKFDWKVYLKRIQEIDHQHLYENERT